MSLDNTIPLAPDIARIDVQKLLGNCAKVPDEFIKVIIIVISPIPNLPKTNQIIRNTNQNQIKNQNQKVIKILL